MTSYMLYLMIVLADPTNSVMLLKGPTYPTKAGCAADGEAFALRSQAPIKEWGITCQPVEGKQVQKNPALGGAMEVTKE